MRRHAGRRDRSRIPARRLPVAARGLQRPGRGRQLRLPGTADRPGDLPAGAPMSSTTTTRRCASRRRSSFPPWRNTSELQYLFDLPNALSPRDAQRRSGGARGQHTSGLGQLRDRPTRPRLRCG